MELSSLGGAKTVPYLVMFAMSNVGGWAGDWLINRRRRSTGFARKAVNTLGFAASAGALMLMPGASGVTYGVGVTTLTLVRPLPHTACMVHAMRGMTAR